MTARSVLPRSAVAAAFSTFTAEPMVLVTRGFMASAWSSIAISLSSQAITLSIWFFANCQTNADNTQRAKPSGTRFTINVPTPIVARMKHTNAAMRRILLITLAG